MSLERSGKKLRQTTDGYPCGILQRTASLLLVVVVVVVVVIIIMIAMHEKTCCPRQA
jgi:hypothetical protein